MDVFNRITKKNNLNLGNKEETAKNLYLEYFYKYFLHCTLSGQFFPPPLILPPLDKSRMSNWLPRHWARQKLWMSCSQLVSVYHYIGSSGETSTLGQGGQIAVVGARVKTVKYMTSSCSFNLGTTFLQHSFPYKLWPNPRPPALC